MGGEGLIFGEKICRKGLDMGARGTIEYVARENRLKRGVVAAIHCLIHRRQETEEDVAHLLDALGHAQIADAHFPEGTVHILEEQVEHRLLNSFCSPDSARKRRNSNAKCRQIMSNRPVTVSGTSQSA